MREGGRRCGWHCPLTSMAEARTQFSELKKLPRQVRREQRREDRADREAMAASGRARRDRCHEVGRARPGKKRLSSKKPGIYFRRIERIEP